MQILYPIVMLGFLILALWISWKILIRLFPEWNALAKKSNIEDLPRVAKEIKKIDIKEFLEAKKTINTFNKEL